MKYIFRTLLTNDTLGRSNVFDNTDYQQMLDADFIQLHVYMKYGVCKKSEFENFPKKRCSQHVFNDVELERINELGEAIAQRRLKRQVSVD